MKKYLCQVLVLLIIYCGDVNAQTDSSGTSQITKDTVFNEIENPIPERENFYVLTPKEFWLSVALLFILLFTLVVQIWLIKTKRINDELSIKLILVTIVLFGALFLITAGYDDQQIAPVFALFGTICGYLLGKSNNEKAKTEDPQQN